MGMAIAVLIVQVADGIAQTRRSNQLKSHAKGYQYGHGTIMLLQFKTL
jgi:hypothetical protein